MIGTFKCNQTQNLNTIIMKTIKTFLTISFVVMVFVNQLNAQTSTSTGTNAGNAGSHNSAYGANALSNTTGSSNSAFGSGTLENNIGGQNNTALGRLSLSANTEGLNNVGVGMYALRHNTTASGNIAIGYSALSNVTTDGGNIAIGFLAASSLTSGKKNILIGSNLAVPVNLDYTIILGNNSNWKITSDTNGYAGIGLGYNQFAQNRLEIGSGISGTAGLRFRAIDSNSPTVASNGKVLTVNANGDVVLTTDVGGSGGGSNVNIYNSNGTLTGNRTVSMVNNRLMFDTNTSGAIYIGDRNDITNNANFPTTTGNYRLYVEGGILTEKVKVALRSTTNWADYVFEENYKLMPLNEVERFINTNKHLPGIASADDLVESGLDLGEMQAKQMEKIEELTLYIIDQNKKVEQQSKEIEELKAMVTALLKQ